MPIDTRHPSYEKFSPIWEKIRAVVAGEDAIKEEPEKYLPRLPGMEADGNYDDYEQYLNRAMFYDASGRTVSALVGAVFRRPIAVNLGHNAEGR
jgi:hypothetical protein